jgi:hypothetical protein
MFLLHNSYIQTGQSLSMNNKFLLFALLSLLFATGATLAQSSLRAAGPAITYDQCVAQDKKITICHATSSETNPYNKLTISCNAIYGGPRGSAGHFSENGTTLAGHEDDVFADENGLCPGETLPSPTPSVSPSPTVSPSPSPSPEVSPDPSPTPGVSPSPMVSPSPTANPSPSPSSSPQPGRQSSLATDNLVCTLTTFDVIMDVKDNGNGVENVTVRFTYNNSTLEAKTNKDGRAKVSFTRSGNGPLTAQVDGYPSQSLFVAMPEVCQPIYLDPDKTRGVGGPGSVLGASTQPGKVLGATTLANTGSSDQIIAYAMMSIGAVLMAFGFQHYVKKA